MFKQLTGRKALPQSLLYALLVCLTVLFLVGCNSSYTLNGSTTNGHQGQGSTSSGGSGSTQSNGQGSGSGNGNMSSSGNQGNGSSSGNTSSSGNVTPTPYGDHSTRQSPPIVSADPTTVQRGGQVTIKGAAFNPGDTLGVSVGIQAVENTGGAAAITVDNQGNFSVTLTIDSQADPGPTRINISGNSGPSTVFGNTLTITQ